MSQYDRLGRLVAQSDALSDTTRYGYDAVGNRTVMTDANGIATRYGYDALSRLITVTENYSTTALSNYQTNVLTRYGYDALSNRIAMTDALTHTTVYTYDVLSRLVAAQDAGGKTQYGYDAVGSRTVMTDANSHVALYAYDKVNRPLVITYTADATTVQYAYDKVGNRLTMTDSTGVTIYVYDALYRPLTITSPFTGVLGSRYDEVGNRTQLIYPNGQVVTYTYDAANRLATVMDWARQTTTYTYDLAGRLVTTTLPNGVTAVNAYDAAGRLVKISTQSVQSPISNTVLLSRFQYELDALGNRVAVTETLSAPGSGSSGSGSSFGSGHSIASGAVIANGSRSSVRPFVGAFYSDTVYYGGSVTAFTRGGGSSTPGPATLVIALVYDPLQRLTSATYSDGKSFRYQYDAMGNTIANTRTITSTVVTSYTYNAANQLVTAKASDDPVTWYYTYDANGSLTSITPNGLTPGNGARRYTYNSASYLVRAETHNGTAYQPQAEMVYNGLGQRVSITAWAGGISLTTRYVLDLLREAAPLAATANGQTTFYVHGRGPLGELTNQWTYYLVDGNRTVRQLSDASGSVTLSRSYTPWGEVLEQHGSGNLTWGYFGGLLDAATGLIYVGNGQYYDPKTGRFLSPVGKGRNPYLPTSRPDPLSAALGPVVLVAVLAGRRRKGKDKWNSLLLVAMVVLMGVGMGVGLTACDGQLPPDPGPQPPTEPPTMPPPSPGPTNPPPPPSRTPTPPPPPSRTPIPTPTCTPTPKPSAGTAYITIDDGPGAYTPQVLDVLAKHQVKATFFLIGNRMLMWPDEVRRITSDGHAIGIHSWDHPDWSQLSSDEQLAQIQKAQEALRSVTAQTSNLFRAPGGDPTTANISGLYNYNWTPGADSLDWQYPEESQTQIVANNVLDNNIGSKPIILIHSIHPVDPPALDLVIQGLKERGYGFGMLPRPGDSPGTGPIT